jgi:signal transduction histidine kinase
MNRPPPTKGDSRGFPSFGRLEANGRAGHDLPVNAFRLGVVPLAVGGAVAGAWLALESNHLDHRVRTAVLVVVIGWSFAGSGLVAWKRRPDSRVGPTMAFVGLAWFAAALQYANTGPAFTVGTALENISAVGFAYLLLAFPDGRLRSRLDRALILTGLFAVTVLQLAWMAFEPVLCDDCPRNVFLVHAHPGVAAALVDSQRAIGIALSAVTALVLVGRWRRATRPLRRAAAPVLVAGSFTFAALVVSVVNDLLDHPLGEIEWVWWLFLATVPFAFLAGLLRTRLARAGVADLVVELGRAGGPRDLTAALAEALGDPSLAVAYWLPDRGRYVDAGGGALDVPSDGRAATVVEREGRRIAALVHDPALAEQPELVESVCAAAGLTLENERLQAELRARLEELRASRARIVEAADAERRRIERNLHDGTQQRLVSVAMALGLAEAKVVSDPDAARPILREAREALSAALAELRELSHGIHPGVLTERGLDAALADLAYRAAIPVELAVSLDERLPQQVEAAAYFVVSEALANVSKYSAASAVTVHVARSNGRAIVEVADDGVGGADAARGSGLRGLADRVEALGGRLALASPAGKGTIVRAEIPCG